jgi:hypothetical protein
LGDEDELMPLSDYSASFRGVTVGDGTTVDILSVEGVEGLPDIRTGDVPRGGVHGLAPGRDLYGARTIVLELEVVEDDTATLSTTLDDLKAAFSTSDESVFAWKLPGQVERQVLARCRRRPVVVDLPHLHGVQAMLVELIATDPLVYDATETATATAFPVTSGGFSFPFTFPLAFGTPSSGGIVMVENDGTEDAPWQATITGPWVNPYIELGSTGDRLTFGITIASGETLVIDAADGARTVLLNGTSSRYSTIQAGSQWFKLPPGSSEVRFGGSSGSGTAELRYRSAWV